MFAIIKMIPNLDLRIILSVASDPCNMIYIIRL